MDSICTVKNGAFFNTTRPFSDIRIFFNDLFWYYCVFKMKLNNFLVGTFLSGTGLVIEFQLQSAITQILESFLNTNTL